MLYESNFNINVQFRSSLEFEKDLYLDRKKSFVRSPDTRRIFFLNRELVVSEHNLKSNIRENLPFTSRIARMRMLMLDNLS